jgi:hypothetical protein
MSIAVRLWSSDDLKKIEEGKDDFLTTVFLNVKTYSREGIQVYYKIKNIKHYLVWFEDQPEAVKVDAVDFDNLMQFLKEEYIIDAIEEIEEVTTTFKKVYPA